MLVAIILARKFSTENFSAYSYFQLTVTMIATYSALGMGVAASRYFAEIHVRPSSLEAPVGTLWLLSVVAAAAFSGLILKLPATTIAGGFDIPLQIFALGVFFQALTIIPMNGVIGLEKYFALMSVAAVSSAVLIVGSVFVGGESARPAMYVFIASSAIQFLGCTFVIIREIGFLLVLRHLRFRWSDLRSIFLFVGPMIAVSVLAASGAWLVGRIILHGDDGKANFALYAIGLQWYALTLLVPGMVARVLLPRLVKDRTVSSEAQRKRLVRLGVALAFFSAITVSLAGALFSDLAISLYGDGYEIDSWVIAGFLVAAIPMAPANAIGNSILAGDGQKVWLFLIFLSFLVMLFLAHSLIEYGVWAGIIAHGGSACILTLSAGYVARKKELL